MSEYWVYTLLGFFGGMIFCFLLLVGFVKNIIRLSMKNGDKDE